MDESWIVLPKSGNKYLSDASHADAAMDLIDAEFPDHAASIRREVAGGNPSSPLQFALRSGAVRFLLLHGSSERDDQEAYVEFDVHPSKSWLVKTLRDFGVKRNWFVRIANKRASHDDLLFSDYCRAEDDPA